MIFFLAAGAAAFGLGCLICSEYERNCLVTEEYKIHSQKIHGSEKTFVFLTDLHNKEFGSGNRRLLEAIDAVKPDAVLWGGDGMIAKKGKADVRVPFRLLSGLAKKYPVYAANGNHENRMLWKEKNYGKTYVQYRDALQKAGVTVLSDSSEKFGEDIHIYGLNLPESAYHGRHPKLPADFLTDRLGCSKEDCYRILLAHSPFFFEEYAAWGADLTLSGHFHGGTIRLPILGGVMTPQYQFFYPRTEGDFTLAGRDSEAVRMIVGRGLGTHSINIRLNNKPQLVVVRLCPFSKNTCNLR